ncbi:MAG: hypothetical protein HOW97_17135 [Catenulispora sp.]|nr:hypothetical protein [Catenulispora sp.]
MTAPAASEPHVAAVVTAADTALQALPTPRHAYNGTRPDLDTACAVVYAGPGLASGPLGDRFADLQITFQVTAVGTGPEQALYIADAVKAALLATPAPAVTGRAVWPLWQTGEQPVQRDDTVQPALYIATAQYSMKSNPA